VKLLFVAFLFLVSCSQPKGLQNLHELVPGQLFRGAQPDAEGYKQLKLRGIRSVVKLNSEHLEEETENAKLNGIHLYYIPLSGIFAPSDREELLVQSTLRAKVLWPLYFHCQWGKDRTGLAAALYRVQVQNWTEEKAHNEWMEFGHSPLLFSMDWFFSRQVNEGLSL
jgi:protein tyrosine/serine phosphatase